MFLSFLLWKSHFEVPDTLSALYRLPNSPLIVWLLGTVAAERIAGCHLDAEGGSTPDAYNHEIGQTSRHMGGSLWISRWKHITRICFVMCFSFKSRFQGNLWCKMKIGSSLSNSHGRRLQDMLIRTRRRSALSFYGFFWSS